MPTLFLCLKHVSCQFLIENLLPSFIHYYFWLTQTGNTGFNLFWLCNLANWSLFCIIRSWFCPSDLYRGQGV